MRIPARDVKPGMEIRLAVSLTVRAVWFTVVTVDTMGAYTAIGGTKTIRGAVSTYSCAFLADELVDVRRAD